MRATMDKTPHPAKADPRLMEALRVKEALALRGLTLSEIDRRFKLSNGTARNTLREPNHSGEAAIAAALEREPHELWPSRYLRDGSRISPQDYSRPPTLRQRRKAAGSLP